MSLKTLFALATMFVTGLADNVISCRDNISGDCGTIQSPNYPNGYPKKKECTWAFPTDKASPYMIVFNITEIGMSYGSSPECTAELTIQTDEVDCKSTERSCYTYRNEFSLECLSLQNDDKFGGCMIGSITEENFEVVFQSNRDNGGTGEERRFSMTYNYLSCNQETTTALSPTTSVTSPLTSSTSKLTLQDTSTHKTLSSATTQYTNQTEFVSTQQTQTATTVVSSSASAAFVSSTSTVQGTSTQEGILNAATHQTNHTEISVLSTTSTRTSTTTSSSDNVAAIVLGTLFIILILIGIAILVVLLRRKRSDSPTSNSIKQESTAPDYDVVYKPSTHSSKQRNIDGSQNMADDSDVYFQLEREGNTKQSYNYSNNQSGHPNEGETNDSFTGVDQTDGELHHSDNENATVHHEYDQVPVEMSRDDQSYQLNDPDTEDTYDHLATAQDNSRRAQTRNSTSASKYENVEIAPEENAYNMAGSVPEDTNATSTSTSQETASPQKPNSSPYEDIPDFQPNHESSSLVVNEEGEDQFDITQASEPTENYTHVVRKNQRLHKQ